MKEEEFDMKEFMEPKLKVLEFEVEDILTLSNPIGEEDSDEAIEMPKT
jgi:hypothetical protein